MDRLRAYPHPMSQRHLFNEIDDEAVKAMMGVTESNYGLGQDYFRLKAKLLQLPRLALYDQYAPVGKEVRPFPYPQAQQVILEAFESFDPSFRQLATEFFAKNWIDAEIRKGKRGGAFCASPSPQLHPYILCNYDDNLRDVMTVAHELGHGMHGCLSRDQNYFNYDTRSQQRKPRRSSLKCWFSITCSGSKPTHKRRSLWSPAKSKISSPRFSAKTYSHASKNSPSRRERKTASHRTRLETSGSKPTGGTMATPSKYRTATAGDGPTFPTSSTRAFTATVTSSASSSSSRFIECTKTKAKALCQNISHCSKPGDRIRRRYCSSR